MKVSLLILAAGESSRMGQPKQLLPWGDTTLLGHVINQALESDADQVSVVLGAHFEKIASSINTLEIDVFQNHNWQKGMGSSIALGLQQILTNYPTQAVIIMLGDQPLVDSNHINSLIAEYQKSEHGIVTSDYGDKVGVPALFDKTYFDALLLLNDEIGAKGLIKSLTDSRTKIDGKGIVQDIDTYEEYLELRAVQ